MKRCCCGATSPDDCECEDNNRCPWCHGTGRQYVERNNPLSYDCPDCNGTGRKQEDDEDEDDPEQKEGEEP